MVQTINIYRQFLTSGLGYEARLVYQEAPAPEPVAEPEAAEAPAAETEADPAKQAEQAKSAITNEIKGYIKDMTEGDNADKVTALQTLLTQLKAHSETGFSELQSEYQTLADQIGETTDHTEVIKKTEALIDRVKNRVKAREALTNQLWNNKAFKESLAKLTGFKKPAGQMTMEDFQTMMNDENITKALGEYLNNPAGAETLAKSGVIDPAELAILKDAEITLDNKKVKINDVFGADFVVLLSMNHNVTSNEEGAILIDGIDLKQINITELGEKLGEKTKEKFDTYLKSKSEGKDKALQEFKELAKNERQTSENMQKIQDALANPDKIKGIGKMGGMELLMSMVKFLPLLKQAYEEMDFKTLSDFAKDLTTNPSQIEAKINQAKEAYENGTKGVDLNQLLAMYHEPYGGEASARVGEETPYRILLREPVKKGIQNQLKIGDITKIEGDIALTRIFTTERGQKSVIEIKDGTSTKYNVAVDKEGNETWNKEGAEVASAETPAPTAPAEATPAEVAKKPA